MSFLTKSTSLSYKDHNSYLLAGNNLSSYSSTLYNQDQDDDEMAEEPIRRQLHSTIDLQNQYNDIVREPSMVREHEEIQLQNNTKGLVFAAQQEFTPEEKDRGVRYPLKSEIRKTEPSFESQKQMLFLETQRQIQDDVHQIMQSKSQFYQQLNDRVRLKQANMIESEIFKQRNLLEQPKETDTYLSKKYAQFYQIAISDRKDYLQNKQQENQELQNRMLDQIEKKDQHVIRPIKMKEPLYNQLAKTPLQGQLYVDQSEGMIVDFYDPKKRELRLRGSQSTQQIQGSAKKTRQVLHQTPLYQSNTATTKDQPVPTLNSKVNSPNTIGRKLETRDNSIKQMQSLNYRYHNNTNENERIIDQRPANTEPVWQPELSADVFISALNKKQQNYLNQERNISKPLMVNQKQQEQTRPYQSRLQNAGQNLIFDQNKQTQN